jgi:hypothetical protein
MAGVWHKNFAHMAPSLPDDSLILIRCPSCGQRFKVGEDLRKRTVECGGCENRFRITDEVIIRAKKFYPGERGNQPLGGFQRVPMASGRIIPSGQVLYGTPPDPAVLEPASPQRIIAGAVGVAAMLGMALLLMFGANRGGMLDGMPTQSRLLMAAFVSLMGILALLYANPRARLKALGVGFLLGAAVLAVPFFFTAGAAPLEKRTPSQEPQIGALDFSEPPPESPASMETTALRNLIGTTPLEEEIKRLAETGTDKRAIGLWLRGLSESNRFLVKDYILRVTRADPATHYYPREGGDFLLVVTGVSHTLQELAELAGVLGEVQKIHQNISVIEVRVNNENFVDGPIDKLSNKEDPAFYDLNKRELESIDLARVKRAVQRLAEAEPKLYRADITRKLISLLGEHEVDFKSSVCKALTVWAEEPGPAGEAALAEIRRLLANNAVIPPEMVALSVKEKIPGVIPVLDELWFKNPVAWESIYADVGPKAEEFIIRRFPRTEGTIRYSAVRLLGKVGSFDSLAVMTAAAASADRELKILIENAQNSIRSRTGN